MGGGGKGGGDSAEPMPGAQFQPYSYKSIAGTTNLTRGGDQYNFSQRLDPRLKELYGTGLGEAEPFLSSYLEGAGQEVPAFDFDKTIDQATQEYFAQQQAALDPVFAQQRQQLQSDLFGSGRMGLMLAADTAGAAGGGMVQPDAFGLSRGQSQALQEAYAQSRAAAVGEQQQAFTQAQQQYELNQAAEQLQLSNLLSGYQGAIGTVGSVLGLEQGLIGGAAEREAMIRQAAAASANAGANLASSGGKGGSGVMDLAVAGAKAYAAYKTGGASGGGPPSDIKLKENIKKVGEQNGFNIYTWDWNDLAKSFGIQNQPTRGVIAQEVMNIIPSAVKPHPEDGYLTVDYNQIGVIQ